jgi:predicted MFS family arabinose efflux permease
MVMAEDAPAQSGSPVVIAEKRGDEARVLAALCATAFLAALNFFAITPFYPEMARDLHTTVPLLGQVVTLMVLISAGLGLAAGPLADHYGYRWPLVVGILAIALNLLITGLAPAYPVLLVCSVVGGLGDALAYGLALAIAGVRFQGDAQRRAIGWTVAALSSAPIVGVPLLTAIGGITSWRVALVLGGLAAVMVAVFVAAALPPDRRRPTTPLHLKHFLAAYAPLLRDGPSLRLYAVAAMRAASWLGLLTYLGAFLATGLGFGTQQVGLVYTISGAAYAAGSVAAGGRLGARSPRTSVIISSLAVGLLLGPLLVIAEPGITLPLLLVTSFAAAVISVGAAALLVAESPAGAGTTMALNGSIINIGAAVGAALGGALIAAGGYTALGIGLPIFAVLGALLAWWPTARSDPNAVRS